MPANEPIQQGPYPEPADSPDGPNQMSAIVSWAAGRAVMRFANEASRDAAIPSPTDGMVCCTESGETLEYWACRGGEWVSFITVLRGSDAGWTDCTLSGVTGTMQVRRVGPVVELRASLTGSFPQGNTNVGSLPSDARFSASTTVRSIGTYFNGQTSLGSGYVGAGLAGVIGVNTRTGAGETKTSVDLQGVWVAANP